MFNWLRKRKFKKFIGKPIEELEKFAERKCYIVRDVADVCVAGDYYSYRVNVFTDTEGKVTKILGIW
jgi:hypothetical protein